MREIWTTPHVEVQEFVANEYVAACYKIACARGRRSVLPPTGSQWNGKEYGKDIIHEDIGSSLAAGTCADASANRVLTDNNGVYQNIQEKNKEQGWIDGGFDKWIDVNGNSKMDAGDIIYWHTFNKGNTRRWNHWGYIEEFDSNHPNHS